MKPILRDSLLVIGLIGLAVMLALGVHGLRPFGHYDGIYGRIVNEAAPKERQTQNVVTAVNFDYRGFDTLGEEFILFAAVAGVTLLLREMRGKELNDSLPQPEPGSLPPASSAVRALATVCALLILFFGGYVVLLAHLSVGGGFQGGVVLSGAWLLVYTVGGARYFHKIARRDKVEAFEAFGAGSFALMGLAALFTGASFLYNFLPKGTIGNIDAAGTILIINTAVGIEVCAGFALLYYEFISELEHRVTRPKKLRQG